MVTSERLDQHLAEWRQKLDRVSQNLIELYELSAYQRLSDPLLPPLAGTTQAEVAGALEAINGLFQQFDLLTEIVDRAFALYHQLPRWLPSEPQLQEIEALLTEESIQLPGTQIPLVQRGLLSAQETQAAIAPSALLDAMTLTFEQAKTIVLRVDAAWNTGYQSTIALDSELAILHDRAQGGLDFKTEISTLQSAIVPLQQQFEADPLGAMTQLEQIQLKVEHLRNTIAQAQQQKDELNDRFKQAHELLQTVLKQQQNAIATYQDAQEKVTGSLQPPPETITALTQWLKRLDEKFAAGTVQAVMIGLENWSVKAKECIAQQQQSIATNQGYVDLRRELRGRLDALQAKAVARGVAEDQHLAALSAQAKQCLYTRPTPIHRAIDLLTNYEKRLNQRA